MPTRLDVFRETIENLNSDEIKGRLLALLHTAPTLLSDSHALLEVLSGMEIPKLSYEEKQQELMTTLTEHPEGLKIAALTTEMLISANDIETRVIALGLNKLEPSNVSIEFTADRTFKIVHKAEA